LHQVCGEAEAGRKHGVIIQCDLLGLFHQLSASFQIRLLLCLFVEAVESRTAVATVIVSRIRTKQVQKRGCIVEVADPGGRRQLEIVARKRAVIDGGVGAGDVDIDVDPRIKA